MDAAAQLFRRADIEHAHFVAVLLAEQRHRAMLDGVVERHVVRPGRLVLQDLAVDDHFDPGDLLRRQRRVVAEVETGLVRIDQRAFLRHVAAQHFAQRLVHQVGRGVVADGAAALVLVDDRIDRVAHFQHAGNELAVLAEHVGLDLQRVFDFERAGSALD